MSVKKRKYGSGKIVWGYVFDATGSTRENRKQIKESGFATRGAAIDAEAERKVDEKRKDELEKAGIGVTAPLPKTLGALLQEFLAHVQSDLAPKTVERYQEQAAYIDAALLLMPLGEIRPLHLHREWNRLVESGGHHRKTKESRPLLRRRFGILRV